MVGVPPEGARRTVSMTKGQLVELCEGLGKRIREERESRGWSQDEMSDRTDKKGHRVSKQSIAKYELDQAMPTAKPLLAIALALGVNPAYLLDERAPYAPERTGAGLLAADVRRVARWMTKLAGDDERFRTILAGHDEPTVERPKGGKGKAGASGHPQQEAG